MPPFDSKKDKVELVSGGQRVNGTFVPRVEPKVSAAEIANPPAPINPPMPEAAPGVDPNMTRTVSNVANQTQDFIASNSAEANKARELATLLGDQGQSMSDFLAAQRNEYQIPQNLKELQDIQLQLADRKTTDDLQKSQITFAPGQTVGQAQRETTQVDREAAIRDAGLAARASVLQGNIQTATALVSQAVQTYYQDRQLNNQNIINQLNYYQGIADDQTAQLIEQEKRQYEEDQAAIEEVKTAVTAAMESGAASSADIATLTNPNISDEERLSFAQSIVARGATEDRVLDREAQRASIASSYQSIAASKASMANAARAAERGDMELMLKFAEAGDPIAIDSLGFDPREEPADDELDKTTERQLNAKLTSTNKLINLVQSYRDTIDDKGFTNTIFGSSETLGKIDSLRGQITAAYKDAEELGTLDNGVIALVNQVIGSEPTSTFNPFENALGRGSSRIVSSLDQLLTTAREERNNTISQLGYTPVSVVNQFVSPEEDATINSLFGGSTGSTPGFAPENYFE